MNKYRIGMAITEKNLQIAVVMKQKAGWRLLETATFPATVDNLRQVISPRRYGFNRRIRQIVLGLPAKQVLMKTIHLDSNLTHDEVYQYLLQQAPTLFGKPADHWIIDFEAQQADLRAVATSREHIGSWLQICHAAGLKIHAVDVDVFALARLIHSLEDYQPDQLQALVWLKTTELVLIAAKSGQLIYTKSIAYSPTQPLMPVLTPLLQFFNGLYPQHTLTHLALVNENTTLAEENPTLVTAALNPAIWSVPAVIQPQEFCSLGLAIYGD